MVVFSLCWLGILIGGYLWYLVMSGNWEKPCNEKKMIFSPTWVIIFNGVFVILAIGLDFQKWLSFLLDGTDYHFWRRPHLAPAITSGLPSDHAMVVGALTVLHPYFFPIAIMISLSRIMLNYHTPFQCLLGYIFGALMINPLEDVINRPAFMPLISLSITLKFLINYGVLPSTLEMASLILTWVPIIMQVVEPY